jgi:hypothetical protein
MSSWHDLGKSPFCDIFLLGLRDAEAEASRSSHTLLIKASSKWGVKTAERKSERTCNTNTYELQYDAVRDDQYSN